MKKGYCTQNNGKCDTCSLVNYGLDCNNSPIIQPQRREEKMKEEKINGVLTENEIKKMKKELNKFAKKHNLRYRIE